MTKTATGNDQPVKTWTMTAVAKKRIPSAKIRVTKKMPEASFCIPEPNFFPNTS